MSLSVPPQIRVSFVLVIFINDFLYTPEGTKEIREINAFRLISSLSLSE